MEIIVICSLQHSLCAEFTYVTLFVALQDRLASTIFSFNALGSYPVQPIAGHWAAPLKQVQIRRCVQGHLDSSDGWMSASCSLYPFPVPVVIPRIQTGDFNCSDHDRL